MKRKTKEDVHYGGDMHSESFNIEIAHADSSLLICMLDSNGIIPEETICAIYNQLHFSFKSQLYPDLWSVSNKLGQYAFIFMEHFCAMAAKTTDCRHS